MEKDLFEIYATPQLKSPSLIVAWQSRDIGKIGSKSIDFLNEKLGGQKIAEIKGSGFFSLGGAAFQDDLIQVPESSFWACEKKDLLIFKSNQPHYEWYKFLNTFVDLAEYLCNVKALYTISGAVSLIAHTDPRKILTVFNQIEFQKKLQGLGLEDMTWEGPPAISSCLLWVAEKRGIPGVSLWPEVPFYLGAKEDPGAIKLTLSFLDKKFNLALDLGGLDKENESQNEKIARLRKENPEINKFIQMLERKLPLTEEEQIKLTSDIYKFL
jgi:proteasome assembly chaperone (PAC2) family protein